MFLDDELYQIGKEANLKDFESLKDALSKMIRAVFNNIDERIGGDYSNLALVKTNFQRVDKSWRIAVARLEKENIHIANPEGFKMLVKSEKELHDML